MHVLCGSLHKDDQDQKKWLQFSPPLIVVWATTGLSWDEWGGQGSVTVSCCHYVTFASVWTHHGAAFHDGEWLNGDIDGFQEPKLWVTAKTLTFIPLSQTKYLQIKFNFKNFMQWLPKHEAENNVQYIDVYKVIHNFMQEMSLMNMKWNFSCWTLAALTEPWLGLHQCSCVPS